MILDSRSRPQVGEPPSTLRGQVATFVTIGLASTLAYVIIYAGLRTVTSAMAANAAALLVTAIGNTAANRRLTFGVRDRTSMVRDQVAGLGAFAIALAITSGAVALLSVLAQRASRPAELAVLIVANVLATATRFVLLRAVIAPSRARHLRPVTDHAEGNPS